ncbi:MAG: Stk1 family PASTA domain-containing Ser/Thr kinase [Candidatus Eremiobacteraeota bacterium]|nr:Stk1 family PASTA domain-containing Ser/Thr kinase [Candidatus Eremiobacteraeota bacterium]
MIEQMFNNRYRLDAKLGEGGMATVYCGTDTLLRRRVAIKVLRSQYAGDHEFVRRFYQEAESAARLQHPNIVNTFDVGREGDTYYIVMELVDGPSLADLIASDGKIPEPVAIDYATQICNGLAYAHRQGLLHRDIKPANILVTQDDVVKLSDFGIARAVSQQTMAMTRPGMVMGSVYYLSPEQAQGHELHETSDLYSLGIVLYQMLTGKLPYSGESPVTVALKHISDPIPTLNADAPGISPALAAIVNKLLQKRPENRFNSASDVATALREARERPAFAAYPMLDDAPTIMHGAFGRDLPSRPSRFPDRPLSYTSFSDAEARSDRSRATGLLALVVVLALATVAGYFFFGRGEIAKIIAPPVHVANYVGLSDAQAQQRIVNAGLAAHITLQPSETVPPSRVISQRPNPGSSIAKDSTIELLVSSGLPSVGLRDVRGLTATDATRILEEDKFKAVQRLVFDSAPKESVISQDPLPGKNIREGSTVTLTVSQGPPAVAMPNLVLQDVTTAGKLLERLKLKIKIMERMPSDTIPAGKITQQDIAPQTRVDPGTVVNVAVSLGPASANVPSVSTLSYKDAVSDLQTAGFKPVVQYSVGTDTSVNGTIIQQSPDPGTPLPHGSAVTILLSISGEVPDTDGMSPADAKDTLEAAGYRAGNTIFVPDGADGRVVRTDPVAGTKRPPGSAITLFVNNAPPKL